MRSLWIALLIALLPLRGWVGDAMAVAMMPTPASTTAPVAQASEADCPHTAIAGHHATAHTSDGVAPSDHAGTHGDDAAHSGHGNASAHLLCDVCNGPVLTTAATPTAAAAVEHGLRIERKQAFASLAPRHVIKPPIA